MMIKQLLILGLLPIAVAAGATCVNDPPEIGDIGPSSELVCSALERQFPRATLAVAGRSIHSPSDVTVLASINGRPVSLRYHLSGYSWELGNNGGRIADVPKPGSNLSPHR
jgi:hypothetical protein